MARADRRSSRCSPRDPRMSKDATFYLSAASALASRPRDSRRRLSRTMRERGGKVTTLVNTVFHQARRSFGSPRIDYAVLPVHMHRERVGGLRSMRRSSWSPPLLMLPVLPRLLEGPHGDAGRLCGGCHCCRRHGCGCWAPVVLARPTASALRKAANTLLQRGGVLERVLHAVKRQQPAGLLAKGRPCF